MPFESSLKSKFFYFCYIFLHFLIFSFPIIESRPHPHSSSKFVKKLSKEINSKLWEKDQQYFPENIYPPFKWSEQGGLFPSYVHLNFHGNQLAKAGRNLYSFPDSNGFVSMFMVEIMLEAHKYGTIELSDKVLMPIVHAITSHRDHNVEGSVPVYHFWNQQFDGEKYIASIPNIDIPLSKLHNGLTLIEEGLKKVGLGNLANKMSEFVDLEASLSKTFAIPADSDDTGCQLAMGAKLLDAKGNLHGSKKQWTERNYDPNGLVYSFFKKYSYEPFQQENLDKSTIDPRTYFWLHDFLLEVKSLHTSENSSQNVTLPRIKVNKKTGQPDLKLITTWMQYTSEITGKQAGKMPFNINNVDASVVANALYGIVSQLALYEESHRSQLPSWWDDELETVFVSSIRLLEWTLRTRVMFKRPDLALLYYPPVYDFYWFVARLYKALHAPSYNRLTRPAFQEARELLSSALTNHATNQILEKKKSESYKGNDHSFWDDFLGNSDYDLDHTPKPTYDDRLFSTAVTLNALMDIWTVEKKDNLNKLQFKEATPSEIKNTIAEGIRFLQDRYEDFPKENAFFSGSIKGFEGVPFFYPANVYEYTNGTKTDCQATPSQSSVSLLVAVRGLMTTDEFSTKLTETCFNQKVPVVFSGYNCKSCIFPYWSSPSLTSGVVLLAVSKYESLSF